MSNAATTQTLTDDMIHELREEAGAAGDDALGHICDVALGGGDSAETARWQCAAAITSARAMGDDTPMVQVVA